MRTQSKDTPGNLSLTLGLMLLILATVSAPLLAQEPPEMSAEEAAMMEAWQKAMTPGPEHAALAEMAGTWKFTNTMWMDPADDPVVTEGTAVRTMLLGGRVLEEKVSSEVMGQPFEGIGQTGYDNVTGEYWSTWFDNMSTGLMTLHGTWDEATDTGTFEGQAADPMTGGMKKVRMVSQIDENGREHNVFYEDRGGEWVKTMELVYQRR
jgi:hypothetical protein